MVPAGATGRRGADRLPRLAQAEFNKPKDALYPDAFDNMDFVAKAGAPGTINITPSAGDWCEPDLAQVVAARLPLHARLVARLVARNHLRQVGAA